MVDKTDKVDQGQIAYQKLEVIKRKLNEPLQSFSYSLLRNQQSISSESLNSEKAAARLGIMASGALALPTTTLSLDTGFGVKECSNIDPLIKSLPNTTPITKTLKGRNGFLFLNNDSNNELQSHLHGIDFNKDKRLTRGYEKMPTTTFLLVLPDKSVICSDQLPFPSAKNLRPGLSAYKQISGICLIDPTEQLVESDYYKTDTHMNLKGLLKCFSMALTIMDVNPPCTLEHLQLMSRRVQLSDLNIGLGDLTWAGNRGSLKLSDAELQDTYFWSPQLKQYYLQPIKTLMPVEFFNYDMTRSTNQETKEDVNLTWEVLSSKIIRLSRKESSEPKEAGDCLLFYDSSSIPLLPLLRELFDTLYLAKSEFRPDLVRKISPAYVLEIRTERFL